MSGGGGGKIRSGVGRLNHPSTLSLPLPPIPGIVMPTNFFTLGKMTQNNLC